MIGIVANDSDRQIVDELFQLFKTPWQPAAPGRRYRVVVVASGSEEGVDSDLVLVYGAGERACDRAEGIAVKRIDGPRDVQRGDLRLPVYGELAVFDARDGIHGLRCDAGASEYRRTIGSRVLRRIGYDLLGEVRLLLSKGQPACHALTPTLDLHIEILRHLLRESRVAFAEILPRPLGHDFIACLTHDVDFYGIRRHKFDRTLAGFMWRASIGTLIAVLRGRRPPSDAIRNWSTLLKLPLIFLGLSPDVWRPFEDYASVDGQRGSTFFLVPFKHRPGVSPDGTINSQRSVAYQISDIRPDATAAAGRGAELAVHGIEAWRDSTAGRTEIAQLVTSTGCRTAGVRMHWLYFDECSPRHVEAAGFAYDSTWGYNEAIGYRAGTSQVFQLPGTSLLELPLAIMDSALFFPGRMNLSEREASELCRQVVAIAKRFGGTVVVNWHDRSLRPERLWGRFYERLLATIEQENRVWFATAADAVEWFRWRRSIRFDSEMSAVVVYSPVAAPVSAAGIVRVHRPDQAGARTEDVCFDGADRIRLEL